LTAVTIEVKSSANVPTFLDIANVRTMDDLRKFLLHTKVENPNDRREEIFTSKSHRTIAQQVRLEDHV
jgi:hypothetical protein